MEVSSEATMLQPSVFSRPNKPALTGLVGSVQRALRILEVLALHLEGLNAKQISQHLQQLAPYQLSIPHRCRSD
jgi:hypothetical protein